MPARATDPASVARVAAALRGMHGRSRLYRWLWDNYAQLHQARQGSALRADWIGAAQEMNKLGIRTRDGKRLTAETVRRTWARVERDAKAAGAVPAQASEAPEAPPQARFPPPPEAATRRHIFVPTSLKRPPQEP